MLVEGVPPGLRNIPEARRPPVVRALLFPLLLFRVCLRVPPEPEERPLSWGEVADPRRPRKPVARLVELFDCQRPVRERREV
jgi:hypothetical protein